MRDTPARLARATIGQRHDLVENVGYLAAESRQVRRQADVEVAISKLDQRGQQLAGKRVTVVGAGRDERRRWRNHRALGGDGAAGAVRRLHVKTS
jgi:hypothetical protein